MVTGFYIMQGNSKITNLWAEHCLLETHKVQFKLRAEQLQATGEQKLAQSARSLAQWKRTQQIIIEQDLAILLAGGYYPLPDNTIILSIRNAEDGEWDFHHVGKFQEDDHTEADGC